MFHLAHLKLLRVCKH